MTTAQKQGKGLRSLRRSNDRISVLSLSDSSIPKVMSPSQKRYDQPPAEETHLRSYDYAVGPLSPQPRYPYYESSYAPLMYSWPEESGQPSGEWLDSSNGSLRSSSSGSSSPSVGLTHIRRIRPTGKYETFIPPFSHRPTEFDCVIRDRTIEEIVAIHHTNAGFRCYMKALKSLEYLAERFMLEHCTTFESLMFSYEMRKCLQLGSIYRHPDNKFFWAVFDNNLFEAKAERNDLRRLGRIPDYQVVAELAIEKGNDETEMLHWLLTDAAKNRHKIDYHKLLNASIFSNKHNTFLYVYSVTCHIGLKVEKEGMLVVARNNNRKEMSLLISSL